MRLATIQEYRRLYFTPDSAPALSTLRANFDKIRGARKIGKRYYVDLDEVEADTRMSSNLEDRKEALSHDPDLAGLV